jgi:hypothetical protein
MAKIGKATTDEAQAADPTAAATRRRGDLKRAIEAGVLGPLRSAQEGVDPSIDKPKKKDEPDLDLEMPVDVPAQEEAQSWEEAVVKMKKQKAQRAAKPRKPKAPPGMERFIETLLSKEGVARSKQEEGRETRRKFMEQAAAMGGDPRWGPEDPDAEWDVVPEGEGEPAPMPGRLLEVFDVMDTVHEAAMEAVKEGASAKGGKEMQVENDLGRSRWLRAREVQSPFRGGSE